METSSKTPRPHIGRKISRMRELLGMKQEALAAQLGITQQSVSKMEQSETIDDEKLEQVAKALGVDSDTLKNFTEEKAIYNIQNNYEGATLNNSAVQNYQCNFNPLDKLMEAIEENKRLYEALLKSEREKVTMLEKILEKK